jgi:DnaJ-class molecular chaperone
LLLDDIQREEKKSQRRDFYKILDVRRDSGPEEIRKSFKKLASQWHPDKNSESQEMRELAEKMFKDINEAYNILSDPKKKKIYDDGGHPDDPTSAFHTQQETYEDIYDSFFGSQSQEKKYEESRSRDKRDDRDKYYSSHSKKNYSSSHRDRKDSYSSGKKHYYSKHK